MCVDQEDFDPVDHPAVWASFPGGGRVKSAVHGYLVSLSSDRQHLSCDVCLEVRGEIIRTVLFCVVY